MDFIEIDLKTGDGGFLIPNTEDNREIAKELLEDPKYILRKEREIKRYSFTGDDTCHFPKSNIQLQHGDCLELMPNISDGFIDLVLADPPYGTTACKWDSIIPLEPMWEQLKRIIKPNKAIALMGSEPFSSALRMSNVRNWKYDWVWNKKKGGNPLLSKVQPIRITEDILIFGLGKIVYFPLMTAREKPKWRGKNTGKISDTTNNCFAENKCYTKRYPKNIIEISNASQKGKIHPTQKPVALMEYLIKTYTNEGETVLDFCMGSGTTGIACRNLNRNFIGIEKDPEYFEIAENRIIRTPDKISLPAI